MILIDTSVIIDFLRGYQNSKVALYDRIEIDNIPFGISPYTYTELLMGARNQKEYDDIKRIYGTQLFFFLPQTKEASESAAKIYYDLRRKGKTVRSFVDLLIAQTAICHDLYLLHNDRDFDTVAENVNELKILETL